MRTSYKVGLAGLMSMAAALAVVPGASAYTPNNGVCEYYETCAFRHTGYGGGMADIGATDSYWGNNDFSGTTISAGNSTSSGGANGVEIQYWDNRDYGGHWFVLDNDQYDSNWSAVPNPQYPGDTNFNDRVSSSVRWIP